MPKKVAMTGNVAVANAMRQINPDVCAAYPITPSTEIVQQFSNFVADGIVDTVLVTVESEHSAMSACIGACAAGGRVMNATSANGLALMWEMLYIASGNRLPIILSCVNRALSAPINIHGDHSDSMGARDSGWIQLYAENAQEAYDNTIMAPRIGEHFDVRLPVMSCMDGFIISHSIENIELLDDKQVKDFIGPYKSNVPTLLDINNPVTMGALHLQDYYIESKRQQHEAMKKAKKVVIDVGKEYGKFSGRTYGLFEEYKLKDADIALVVLNSAAGTAKVVVDELRKQGIKAGLLKPRLFRPFPYLEVANALKNCTAVCVMDRADSFGGAGGPLFTEVRSALYDLPARPLMINKIYGLGGRDLGLEDVRKVYRELVKLAESGKAAKLYEYITVRD
ncbi:MAG: pyruvate ferredoxin oxidoreductase [Nitrospirae bacterium]|nr:pyruvate ferredoxin oxidoreductase [Nitrospirota bacterium]